MTKLTVNNVTHDVASGPDTPLLWVLRDELGLDDRSIAALTASKAIELGDG